MIHSGTNYGLLHMYEQDNDELQYYWHLDDTELPLNTYLGDKISINFTGKINCIHCGRDIKKTFNSGYCFPCFRDLPQNDICIVKPNLCHFADGTCRDEQFGLKHCMKPHFVYLAVSSELKVGLTRETNSLKRWGDQGASQAVPIAKLPTRKEAGDLELELMEHYADKTNWRKMLKGEIPEIDMLMVRDEAIKRINNNFTAHILDNEQPVKFTYPIIQAVTKLTSYNLDKTPTIEDNLIGIKGQYLLFEKGVLNIRKYEGYHLQVQADQERNIIFKA